MDTNRDVLEISLEVGKRILVFSQGNPAVIVAGALVVAATAVGYGGYRYGSKLVNYFGWE